MWSEREEADEERSLMIDGRSPWWQEEVEQSAFLQEHNMSEGLWHGQQWVLWELYDGR